MTGTGPAAVSSRNNSSFPGNACDIRAGYRAGERVHEMLPSGRDWIGTGFFPIPNEVAVPQPCSCSHGYQVTTRLFTQCMNANPARNAKFPAQKFSENIRVIFIQHFKQRKNHHAVFPFTGSQLDEKIKVTG